MNYTIQLHTESGCFSSPGATNVLHCNSKADIRHYLERWQEEVQRYSEEPCSALVWKGKLTNVTDVYPDYEATLGVRGGFHLNFC
jgi:hypothetical protein